MGQLHPDLVSPAGFLSYQDVGMASVASDHPVIGSGGFLTVRDCHPDPDCSVNPA